MSSGSDGDRRADERITGLRAITRQLDDCEGVTDVYHTVVESLDAVFEFDAAVVYALDDGTLRPLATAAAELHPAEYPGADEGIAGAVLRSGEPRVVDDLGQVSAAIGRDEFRSALTVPIDDERGLQLLSTEPEAFSGTDLESARLVCTQAVSALDRVVSERQAQRERDEFAVLFENVADPVLRYRIQDGKPVVDRVNTALIRRFGVTPDTVAGTPLNELPGQPEEDPPEWTAARRGDRVERRLKRQTTDGVRQFLLRTVPGTHDGPTRTGTGYVIYVDVEESRRREQMEVLNRFLRHNVRNDVDVLRTRLERAVDRLDDATVLDHLDAALRASDRLERRSQKARDAQKLIGRAADRGTARFDLDDLVAERVDAAREEFPGADIDLSRPENAVTVAADNSLPLAIDELLENGAVHAGDSPSIEVTVTAAESTAEVSIADDGPGIPEQETRVIERGEETQLDHGSGVGLWLVAWVVDASDGALSFGSPDSGGTLVRITLPLSGE